MGTAAYTPTQERDSSAVSPASPALEFPQQAVDVQPVLGRYDVPTCRELSRRLADDQAATAVLSCAASAQCFLAPTRQILQANQAMLDLLGETEVDALLGLRPGEAFGCLHAEEAEGGCGMAVACGYCLTAQLLHLVEGGGAESGGGETAIVRADGSTEFAIKLQRVRLAGLDLLSVGFLDRRASAEKQALNRLIYHDLLNVANGVIGLIDLLQDDYRHGQDCAENIDLLSWSGGQLIDEIRYQRSLHAAVNGNRGRPSESVALCELLQHVAQCYSQDFQLGSLSIDCPSSLHLVTDRTILVRVLGNLLRNAVEADGDGRSITIEVESDDDRSAEGTQDRQIVIHVRNRTVIPAEVQAHLFKRHFSTKGGVGRGLGTYASQLLVRNSLGGQLRYRSTEAEGTVFSVALPVLGQQRS